MEVLPSYKELKCRFPLTDRQQGFIEQSRQMVRQILGGTDPRLLLIIGPCSIHDLSSAKEFATHLKKLSLEISPYFSLIMRVYCEKPRSSTGWKGFLYDPFLDGSHDIQQGIQWTRQLLLELADLQVPAATEFLDPLTAFYYDDLITWGSIGARTSSSQPHRQLASSLLMPIGIKNGVAGNLSAAVNGVSVASSPQTYLGLNLDGQLATIRTLGNQDTHIVLRGGDNGPNYDLSSVQEALRRLGVAQLPPRLLIDCSHQNSGKRYDKQPLVFQSILHQIVEGNSAIRGLLLESHLYEGNQPLLNPSHLKYGISITDGCLDWYSTERLIKWGLGYLLEHSLTLEEKYLPNIFSQVN
jgi:3-deoxy-7-phosphoheptulonate synthase